MASAYRALVMQKSDSDCFMSNIDFKDVHDQFTARWLRLSDSVMASCNSLFKGTRHMLLDVYCFEVFEILCVARTHDNKLCKALSAVCCAFLAKIHGECLLPRSLSAPQGWE